MATLSAHVVTAPAVAAALGLLRQASRPKAGRALGCDWWLGRRLVCAQVIKALLDPATETPAFLACCATLRVVAALPADRSAARCRALADRLEAAAGGLTKASTEVGQAVDALRAAGARALHVREQDLARALGMHASHFGRLLRQQTGVDFRRWKWAVAFQPAIAPLVLTNRPIKAIAFDTGFMTARGSIAPFDRCARAFLGLTPTGFRRFSRRLPAAAAFECREEHDGASPPAARFVYEIELKADEPRPTFSPSAGKPLRGCGTAPAL